VSARFFSEGYRVRTFDVHNPDMWFNGHNYMPSDLGLPLRPEVDYVIAPDKGAHARALDFMNAYCPNASLMIASKERNPDTGELSNYRLEGDTPPGIYLVVDDICDGGGTFQLLAQEFYCKRLEYSEGMGENGPTRLELFVSHGIFSKPLNGLLDGYHHIYTTDSFFSMKRHLALNPAYTAELIAKIQARFTVHALDQIVQRVAA
jgi:phosphoribosylpyrophosphate synthetase